MKTVIILGSPREKSFSTELAKKLANTLKGEIVFFNLYKLNLKPCIDCRACYKSGKCFIKDDMEEIYLALEECDNLVIATPVYFNTVSAPLKAMIDRLQVYWSRKFILKDKNTNIKSKKGVIIAAAGSNTKSFETLEKTLEHVFILMKAEVKDKIYVNSTDNIEALENEELKEKIKSCALKLKE